MNASASYPRQNLRPVMVVDDDAVFRQELEWHLRRRGHAVVSFSSALEAMEQLRWGLRPCLILLDLRMSVMTGWEFRAEQRADPAVAGIPVVAMTTGNWKASDNSNFAERLEKPFELDALHVLLDRYCRSVAVTAPGEAPAARRPVLVVDDNPDILAGMRELLEEHGYAVLTARNGREALDAARTGQPRLILLDLAMPEVDGWQFLELRSLEPLIRDVPVVIMSAYARTSQVLGGTLAVLSKPVDPGTLVETVRRYERRIMQ